MLVARMAGGWAVGAEAVQEADKDSLATVEPYQIWDCMRDPPTNVPVSFARVQTFQASKLIKPI